MNDNPETTRRKALKQITLSLFLALAALVLTVFTCYAWFSSNAEVSGSQISIRLDDTSFELASVGGVGAFDNDIPSEYKVTGDDWSFSGSSGTSTGGSKDAVLWRISPASNFSNLTSASGIRPGTSGSLQFYVIPKRSGTMNLTFQLDLILIDSDRNTVTDEAANRFARSHILFAYQKDGDSPALVPYNTGIFSLENLTVVANTPIHVTLHWIWPLFLTNILDHDLTGDFKNSTISSQIVNWMNTNPGDFFFNGNDSSGNPITINPPQFGTQNPVPKLVREYSNYYNNADQCVGQSISGIVLQLNAMES